METEIAKALNLLLLMSALNCGLTLGGIIAAVVIYIAERYSRTRESGT